jgi:hypothetical protein
MKYASLFLLFIFLYNPAYGGDYNIPNASLRVTVQQKEEGKITKGFHVLELSCWEGNCSLSSKKIGVRQR